MKRIALIVVLILVSAYARADVSSLKGLCYQSETAYFACQTTRERWVSLCGVAPEKLQYRFGRENHMEFIFPQKVSQGAETFLFAHYMRYQADRTEVGFSNNGVDYTLFSHVENEEHRAGVRVTTSGGKEREFLCTGNVTDHLNELKEVLRWDPDNALNMGNCPP